MQSPTKLIVLVLFLFLFYSCHHKTTKENYPKKPAYVNFTLGESTLPNKDAHTITLFGCNTSVTANSNYWNGPKTFQWKKSNQILSGVPFGHQKDSSTGKPYYVSKYYIASPPVFKFKDKAISLYDIGLVTPDEFSFDGKSPTQMVYLDYNILKPMHVDYIDIKFDKSFDSLQVGYVPFRVECNDLPWIDTERIKGAKGASGIGSLEKGNPHAEQLFLPYYFEEESTSYESPETKRKYLDTKVTILNDVLLNYKIKFILGKDSLVGSINLKDFYDPKKKVNSLRAVAIARHPDSIPSGCVKPIAGGGEYEGID